LRLLAQRLLRFELLIILVVVYVFWLGDASRVLSLLLLLPLLALRLVAYGRPITRTPLNLVLLALLLLSVLNVFVAPYSRGNAPLVFEPLDFQTTIPWAWVMLGRPLMGIAVYFALVEHARHYGLHIPVAYTVLLGLIVALLALVSTQWNSKSVQLAFIIVRLPQIREIWLAPGGFNANEIAGGMAWLAPLCAGLAFFRWRWRWLQYGAALAFALLLLALFLGQSRLAIAGVLVALAALSVLLVRTWRWRVVALFGVAVLVAIEAALVSNVFAPPGTGEVMETRDENSTAGRLEMYLSVLQILDDHPWTGVGMNMYRDGQVRQRYPVPTYEASILPHAHNEFLQLGADFGYPGLLIFIGLYGMAAYMVWRCWRSGDRQAQVVAIATAAALLGHGVYGTGDAVALWDRFIFVFWSVLGLLAGQYVMLAKPDDRPTKL
jgi:O-antigen ligase